MMENDKSPRMCNTGAQNTYANSLRACVDWVQATFTNLCSYHDVFEILGLDADNFLEMDTGMMGYKRQLKYGNIIVLGDGKDGMGYHLLMPGQACRDYEDMGGDWIYLFRQVMTNGHFTRLDIAIDDFGKYLDIKKISRKIKTGQCRSKFKTAVKIESVNISDGASKGTTIYFGSNNSRIKIRFYDKLAERIQAGKDVEEGIDNWVRAEIQARDKRADVIATFIIMGEPIGQIARGIMANYINFVDRKDDTNKARWPVTKWWMEFLDGVDKLKITLIAPDRTVERSRMWIDRQVKKTLGMLYIAYDRNLDWLKRVIYDGINDLTDKEMAIIKRYQDKIKCLLHEDIQQACED